MGRKKGPREASVQIENALYKTVNYMVDLCSSFRWQRGHVRELELEPGKKYKMITLASKPPVFGKTS